MITPSEGAVLNIYKPAGITSFDVIRILRRKLGIKKIGHGGTLDPIAEGVLIILVGKATKKSNELISLSKTYRAGILLGVETDSYDISGKTVKEMSAGGITDADIENVLVNFRGEIEQIPPMFSALKVKGKKLYQLARKGIEIERKPRKVTIGRLDKLSFDNPRLSIEVDCSKGTYIRSLAHDIGSKLGCGACMESLIRTRVGEYHVADSIRLEEISEIEKKL